MTAERVAELAALGIELPARAVVVSSAADADGYRATVDVLTPAGERTGQMLEDLPLDRLWQTVAGAGVFAPPAPDQQVLVNWESGNATGPIVVSAAPGEPAAPRLTVNAGEHSLQGETFDVRMLPDEWKVSDEAGTQISAKSKRVKVASPDDDLLAALVALGEAIRDGATVFDTDTQPGSAGKQLANNAATKTAINSALDRVRAVLRT